MTPNDPRHGTTRGFHAGCREPCCKRASARYEKKRRLDRLRGGRQVPAIGAQRRIHALMRLGWTSTDIAEAAGMGRRESVLRIVNGQKGKPTTWIERKTHAAITDVYERLSMRLPDPAPHRARTRAIAERKGFAPPLAWDDIDDPDEQPATRRAATSVTDIDEAVVLRVLAGERLICTRAEKDEVMRRWRAAGGSERELCRRMAWKDGRYGKEEAAA
jgi:hypothetical protein